MTNDILFQNPFIVHLDASTDAEQSKNHSDKTIDSLCDFFGPVISSYSQADALADGTLVDVSKLAREAGFKCPVVMTSTAYDKYVDWNTDDNERQGPQDITGRLWDVLCMLRFRISGMQDYLAFFTVSCIPRDLNSRRRTPIRVRLKAIIDGGDNGDAVITIMMPDED